MSQARVSLLQAYRRPIKVELGDNWLILGTRGSGKTTFAKTLTRQLSRLYPDAHIYVLDIKRRDFNSWPNILSQDEAPPPLKHSERIQVWQPVIEREEEIERWLGQIEQDSPALLYIDELSALIYGKKKFSEGYRRLQKLGRGLPVGIISLTQELGGIPQSAIEQSTHTLRFRVKGEYNKRVGDGIVGKDDKGEPRHKYGFFYACEERHLTGLYYKDKDEFFSGSGGPQ